MLRKSFPKSLTGEELAPVQSFRSDYMFTFGNRSGSKIVPGEE